MAEPTLFLLPGDAGEIIGVHAQTIRRWLAEGRLRLAGVTSRGDRLLFPEDVRRLAAERAKKAARR